MNEATFSSKTFQDFIDQYLIQNLETKKAKQKRRLLQCDNLRVTTTENYFTLTNNLSNRRNINRDKKLSTTPFGYVCNLN